MIKVYDDFLSEKDFEFVKDNMLIGYGGKKNMDKQLQKIINNCELDWDPNCLLFYKNKSPIKTASAFQARQPIYNSSVNKDASLFKNIFSDRDFSNI